MVVQSFSLTKAASTKLDTQFGPCEFTVYTDDSNKEHLSLVYGEINAQSEVLVRIHSECMTGDVFFSEHCDCGPQLHQALAQISQAKAGVLIYLRQEGRGIGLINKIKAYELQRNQGLDTYEANKALNFDEDERGFEFAGIILKDLGIKKIKLLTNNPQKLQEMMDMGINAIRANFTVDMSDKAKDYISAKVDKHQHFTT